MLKLLFKHFHVFLPQAFDRFKDKLCCCGMLFWTISSCNDSDSSSDDDSYWFRAASADLGFILSCIYISYYLRLYPGFSSSSSEEASMRKILLGFGTEKELV